MCINDKKSILLAEDDVLIAMAEKMELENYGYTVYHVATGETAVKAILEEAFCIDLILMDIDLGSGIDGTQAAEQILEHKDIPIVFLSSHAESEVVEKTEKITSYGYVIKNSGIVILDTSIKMAFKLFEANKKLYESNMKLASELVERKRIERELKESKLFFEKLLDTAPVPIFYKDNQGRYTEFNKSFETFLGKSRSEIIGKSVFDINPPELASIYHSKDEVLFKNIGSQVYESKVKTVKGEIHDVVFHKTSLSDKEGNITGLVGAIIDITESKKNKQNLKQIQWMLSKKEEKEKTYTPEYGELTELNENGLILTSLGKDELIKVSSEYLDLMETSSAIYEKNGDYALGLFSSGWCKMMDAGSRMLCNTGNNREALSCGKWLCHESCWRDASLKSIESKAPVDVECAGGLRLYAVPIFANEEVVGAINFGYGNPPEDDAELRKLADLYKIPVKELYEKRAQYQTRPQFIIDYAKKRIQFSARHIGSLVERHQMEKALKASNENFEATNEELTTAMEEMEAANEELISTNQALQHAEGALKESEEKYRSIFTSMTEMVVLHELVFDGTGRPINYKIIDCNPAFTRITGIRHEDAAGRLATDVYGSDTVPYLEDYARVAMTGETVSLVTLYQPMKKQFEINVASPAKNMFVTVTTDITERIVTEKEMQKQLAEKEVLLREIHHRVKNNITNIANLLSFQIGSTNNREVQVALQDATSRVQSMRVLYEKLLVSEDLREVSIKNYIDDLIKSIHTVFEDKKNIVIQTSISDFRISSKKAITIGIIINELLTNIFKYAFIDQDEGTAFVSIDKDENMVNIIIQDTGIGIDKNIRENVSTGFGLTIVKMLVEQLEGTYTIDNKNGTKSTVSFEI